MKIKKPNRKTTLGIFSLFTFIFFLVMLSNTFGNGVGINRYKYKIENFFERFETPSGGKNQNAKEIQKLVEEESSLISVVEKASPSVVSIVVETVNFDFFSGPSVNEEGIGTGFIVDSNGVIVTNSHVVSDPSGEYSVVLNDGTTYVVEDIHLDRMSDLAIIEVTARDLPALELADSDTLQVGQTAIAIGNALGKFQNTVTRGIVSGISREIVASSGFGAESTVYEEVIQTDAALNPGNSGGPLLNLAGQVIGINVATTPYADNISFAIPSNTLAPLLTTFLEKGRIVRPYLGVSYRIVTEEIAKLRDLSEGAYIASVYPDSPADKAGLERGDIILSVEGEEINAKNTLVGVISRFSVGETLKVVVDRGGESREFFVTLAELPREF
ncbi:PDZ domain-containing protein [candidate division WWE3 bacterium]|nr:PDZ domain-containing protein [candidate division WWE3 bacterium]